MRRVIGMDIHRTFAEVVFWEDGKLRAGGRIGMTRAGLEGFGLSIVGRVPLPVRANQHNLRYLRVKRDRMGHDLPGLPWYDDEVSWAALATRPAGTSASPDAAEQVARFGLDSGD